MKLKKLLWIISILIMMCLSSLLILYSDNLLVPYIISLFVIILYAFSNITFFSSGFFFISFYIMLFYIQPIIHFSVDDTLLVYSPHIHRVYALITINGIFLFLIGYSLIKKKIKNSKHYAKEIINTRKLMYFQNILCIIVVVTIIFVIIYIGPRSILYGSRIGLKEQLGLVGLLTNYMGYIASILIFLIFFNREKYKNKMSLYFWILIFIIVEIFYLFVFRLRSFLIGHLMAVILGMYFNDYFTTIDLPYKDSYFINQLKLKMKKFKMVFALLGIFVFAIAFRFIRGYLEPGQSISNFTFDIKNLIELSIKSGDLGYANMVMDVISIVPSNHPYLLGQSYYRLFFVLIPRFIWGNKPINTQRIVASWLRPEIAGLTLPPGISGDFYINFGIMGMIIMIFFGLLFKKIDSELTFKNVLIWASSPVWVFHLVRGGFTNPLIIFFMLYIISRFIAKKCKV